MRFRDVMVELGSVKATRAYLLEDATAPEVRSALTEMKCQSGCAPPQRQHAAARRIAYSGGVNCGTLVRYSVALERLRLRGEVLISSSGPEEASEDWDRLLTGLRGDA